MFVFGTLRSDSCFERVTGYPTPERIPAKLHDFRKQGLNIFHAKGEIVDGDLLEVTEEMMVGLDRYEGYPTFYTRIDVEVETPDGMVPCQAYKIVGTD